MPYAPLPLTPQLYAYVDAHTGPEPTLLAALRAHVEAQHPQHHMITPWPTAQLLAFLVRLTRPRTLIEVGTFVGYSTLAMAMAMGADAHLHTIDHDTTTLAHGRPFWKQSGNTAQISVHEGDGLDQLQKLHTSGTIGDFFYIDANKRGYADYLEAALQMAAPGALLAFDNTLSEGKVLDQDPKPFVKAIQAFNQKVRQQATPLKNAPHALLNACLLPVGDGLTLIQKTS